MLPTTVVYYVTLTDPLFFIFYLILMDLNRNEFFHLCPTLHPSYPLLVSSEGFGLYGLPGLSREEVQEDI